MIYIVSHIIPFTGKSRHYFFDINDFAIYRTSLNGEMIYIHGYYKNNIFTKYKGGEYGKNYSHDISNYKYTDVYNDIFMIIDEIIFSKIIDNLI